MPGLRVQVQGAALDRVAKKTVKVLIVGNPANTNVRFLDFGPNLTNFLLAVRALFEPPRAIGARSSRHGSSRQVEAFAYLLKQTNHTLY